MTSNIKSESLLKFESPTTVLVVGASGTGKTTTIYSILRNASGMFKIPPKKIIYAYSAWQPLFDEMRDTISNIEFHEGLPTRDTI